MYKKLIINHKIKQFIAEKEMIWSDIAKRTGMSSQNWQVILGRDDIKVSQLGALCDAFELPYDYFFDANKKSENKKVVQGVLNDEAVEYGIKKKQNFEQSKDKDKEIDELQKKLISTQEQLISKSNEILDLKIELLSLKAKQHF